MPRRARLAIAGIPWHIIQRGNNRSACFFTDDDYVYYLNQLAQQSRKFGCHIHAYCLMTNHVHLLLTPESADSPSLMMKNLGQCYVQYVNRSYRRTGTLWEGRYKSCLAQDESYALACYRYIELNPVRAKMVTHPQEYPWSSYAANGNGNLNNLITPHPSYLCLGDSKTTRLENYRQLLGGVMEDSVLTEIRNATNGNFVLGDDRFREEIEQALQRRVSPGQTGRPRLKN
ncbi:MAG: transposase [Halioglobus sp.]